MTEARSVQRGFGRFARFRLDLLRLGAVVVVLAAAALVAIPARR
jgi:hypothetical protein